MIGVFTYVPRLRSHMDRKTITGIALSLVGFLGYVAGVYVPYPAVMLGMAILAGMMLVHFRRQDWI
jgi:hypothetical protein